MVKIKYAYCKYCEKEIHKPVRKPLDSYQKTKLKALIIGTLGIGYIAYLIYNKFLKKKNYCPTCHSKLQFSAKPFEKPKLAETLTAKQKAMAKAEKKKTRKAPAKKKVVKKKEEKEEEAEEFICPYCGNVMKEKLATCTDCSAQLKF